MLHTKSFSVKLFGAALLLGGVIATGCNNDKKEPSVTSVSSMDTASMKVDSSNSMVSDGSTAAVVPATTADTAGTAKPNAAKKGMKGKATITMPTKGTGSMEADNTGVYSNVEYLPSFPGGNKGLQKFFDDNLEYPAAASDDGVEGTVNVSFVVDENGKLTSPQVVGAPLGYGIENEAIRVVNKMPVWNPGKLKGRNVKTRFTLPVVFQLY
ncbi:energy transducer TonB [Ferruginibacter sp. HRS2-29]|uniref:energy transducer TonB n=1 Tax=Ferruginibacter sp. HRS2-29 TaxID=2487334 RepID=UPI0020CCF654|nr:energy transducer TonB [Ferruginibacter sp. HRS2-29]MCP9753208.1 energy transducer TonB [Ferruginibacter sp. HRS2-29]